MIFDSGLDIQVTNNPLYIQYGDSLQGPIPECRTLDSIRSSLKDPNCEGPDVLYCISMDVYHKEDRQKLIERNLLYGVVVYASGTIGKEPVRSQGHIHACSPSCNSSTCEVYEIWEGKAIIYMQESGEDEAGKCIAVYAEAGDVVIVPPGWVHATINANPQETMTFGAWCVRDYGFEYEAVRRHKGIAYYPIVEDGKIEWEFNPSYKSANLILKKARDYPEFCIEKGKSIYKQFQEDPDRFLFVSRPELIKWNQIEV